MCRALEVAFMILMNVFHLLTKFTNGKPMLFVVANKSFLISVTWAYRRDAVMTQIYKLSDCPIDCGTALDGNFTLD